MYSHSRKSTTTILTNVYTYDDCTDDRRYRMNQHTRIPLVEAFSGQTRQEMIRFLLTDAEDDRGYQMREVIEHISVSRESLRQNLPALERFGLIDIRDQDKVVPKYVKTDTEVVHLLSEYGGVDLLDLLEATGTRKLVQFFLTEADPDRSYSKNAIREESNVGYNSVTKYTDDLADTGLLARVEGPRSDQYRVRPDSPLANYLTALNEALYKAWEERGD